VSTADNSIESATAFAQHFLRVFENLDLAAFLHCFADDATVFFPAPEPASRFAGRQAIGERFERVFEGIRAGAASGPPWHRLDAEELAVQLLSPDAAVVTFHLRNEVRIARRSLVLRRTDAGWRIAHLHASNAAIADG